MKNLILQLLLLIAIAGNCKGQTAITSYPFPGGLNAPRNAINIDAAGNKWIAFHRMGLGKFDGVSWTMFDTLTSSIAANQVNDVVFDGAGNVWAATIKGLCKYDGTAWTTYNVINSSLPDDSVSCLFSSGADLWIGTRNGLARFNGTTWNVYTTATTGLLSNRIECLAGESSGDLWIGTKSGLNKKSGSTWTNYNSTNPYLVNHFNIRAIYIDAAGTKWIGATGTLGNGLYKLVSGELVPLKNLFPYYQELAGGGVISSITKGPHGGVAFHISNDLFEVAGSQIHKYNAVGGDYNIMENSTGLIWYVKWWGSLSFYSFDPSLYTLPTLQFPYMTSGINSLDINMVRASLLNKGDMHWNLINAGYEVPKNSERHSIFASALWMGGIDNAGILHNAAMTYRQTGNDYWPGPLDTITGTTDSITSASFDNIWKIDRFKIEEFKYMFANGSVASGAYTVDNDILTWPALGYGSFAKDLAPFIDVNADGLYNPLADGDYPDIKGDQMCYWIFNDNLHPHTETGSPSLKVEVHASAYAYTCSDITDSLKVLNYTTFYNYKIFNRGSLNYHDTYLGIWQDTDLGSANDDYVGCNPSLNYGSVRNGDTIDDNPPAGQAPYGLKPPMLSTVILNGPPAAPGDGIDNNNNGVTDESGEKNLMTHFVYYNNDNSTTGNPSFGQDFYNYMKGIWKDNTPTTYGGTGHLGSIPHNFMFDGIPYDPAGWSEETVGNVPADRRFLMSSGPFDLNAGENVSLDYAIVYTRDTIASYSAPNLWQKNREDVMKIQQWFAADSFPSCLNLNVSVPETEVLNELSIYPNPTTGNINVKYSSGMTEPEVLLFNMMGQLIQRMDLPSGQGMVIQTDKLKPGIYLLSIHDAEHSFNRTFIKK